LYNKNKITLAIINKYKIMDYKKDYEEFLNKYNAGTEDAEGVGAQIARFAQHYLYS